MGKMRKNKFIFGFLCILILGCSMERNTQKDYQAGPILFQTNSPVFAKTDLARLLPTAPYEKDKYDIFKKELQDSVIYKNDKIVYNLNIESIKPIDNSNGFYSYCVTSRYLSKNKERVKNYTSDNLFYNLNNCKTKRLLLFMEGVSYKLYYMPYEERCNLYSKYKIQSVDTSFAEAYIRTYGNSYYGKFK